MSKVMAASGLMVKPRPSPAAIVLSDSDVSDSTASSSPVSCDSDHRTFSLSSIKGRTWRSFSNRERDPTPDRSNSFRAHVRKLSKSRPLSSSSHFDPLGRRASIVSNDHGRFSLSTADSLSLSASTSSSSIDWKTQHVEGSGPLEPDTLLLKTKTPYLVVTADYLVKLKSRADALVLLPALAEEGCKQETSTSVPEPLLVIPVASIVTVFVAESTRPSFGFQVWWKNPLSGHALLRSEFFFSQYMERNEQMHHIIRAMRASQRDESSSARLFPDVEGMLNRIHEVEEPKFHDRKPEIFPVVPRGYSRREYMAKLEDATKKPQEGPAFYLVVGTYLCHLAEVHKGKGGDPVCRHRSYGLVTLESLQGEWIIHEERFLITFRDPFKLPVTLELASRYYRQIMRAFGTADRFVKPVWPQLWQSMEIFQVSGLKEPQYLVPREDFGSFRRTLHAYLAAYHCSPVEWEINWKSRFAPEFRLLSPKCGSYSALQLLAVLRALRYNDYFNSLSFRDVDLSALRGLEDNVHGKPDVAYLSRTCVALGPAEVEVLRISPLLHQEFHALAFCSETIRQIDLTNCSRPLPSRFAQHSTHVPSLQFLTPILNLLRSGITKCNRLILSGNTLPQFDIDDLAETMKTGTIQALDVSHCGLDDASLRDMIVAPLSEYPAMLQSLSVSGNPGRLPAHVVPVLLQRLPEIRVLNLGGSIQGDNYIEGSLLSFAVLACLETLQELDISGYKVDDATFLNLEQLLHYRSWRLDEQQPTRFHKLVLNHCGITGTQAARLFHAIGEGRGMHLCLSGNPIEDGVQDLAAAIRQQKGPVSLYMEMIEFKEESSYLSLIGALTEAKHVSLLSLAGTAPSCHGPCSQQLVTTLHDFFARNTSVRYLDLSGFCGKLDDGQLAKGFGRSLSGLASNTTMTHLRIRNQNLHDDAGTLGRVLAENSTLQAVDCRDNNLNLTSLRFLVDSLKANTTVVEFPLPAAERRAIWCNILRGLQRTPSSTALSAPGTISANHSPNAAVARDLLKEEESLLRGVLDAQFAALDARLRENRAALEEAKAAGGGGGPTPSLDLDLPTDEAAPSPSRQSSSSHHQHRHHHQHHARSNSTSSSRSSAGGVVFPGEEGWPAFDDAAMVAVSSGIYTPPAPAATTAAAADHLPAAPDSEPSVDGGRRFGHATEEADAALRDLYIGYYHRHDADHGYHESLAHIHGGGGGGLGVGGVESPAETLDPVSEVETPVEEKGEQQVREKVRVRVVDAEAGRPPLAAGLAGEGAGAGEGEGDEWVFRKMVEEFRAAGFEV